MSATCRQWKKMGCSREDIYLQTKKCIIHMCLDPIFIILLFGFSVVPDVQLYDQLYRGGGRGY
jgi:hypothetical protein